MKVAIVYDSGTGTTKAAAEAMAELVRQSGHDCTVSSVHDADPTMVSAADAVCVGSWCKGLFFVAQRATEATMDFIDASENSMAIRPRCSALTRRPLAGCSQRWLPGWRAVEPT